MVPLAWSCAIFCLYDMDYQYLSTRRLATWLAEARSVQFKNASLQTGNRTHRHSQNSSNSINHITNIALLPSCNCSLWIPNAQESNAIERKRGTGIAAFQNSTRSAYQITVHNVSSNCQGTPKPGKNMVCLQLNVFDDCSWLELWK